MDNGIQKIKDFTNIEKNEKNSYNCSYSFKRILF